MFLAEHLGRATGESLVGQSAEEIQRETRLRVKDKGFPFHTHQHEGCHPLQSTEPAGLELAYSCTA